MPFPSAWSATFPQDIILDSAVLDYDLGSGTRAVLGMTRGGNNFVSGEERRTAEYDGQRHTAIGTRRMIGWTETRFEGTLVQVPLATYAKFLPGATSVAAGTPAVTTYTPAPAGHVLVLGDLLLKPRLNWLRGDGGYVYVEFDYGEVAEWPGITAQDKNEGTFAYRILAMVDPAAVGYTTSKAPFRVVTVAAA